MGLSTVTPRSFNSTGAQSVCRANQPQPETPIESQFLTQCNLEYIHGSGQSIIRGSLGSLPLETTSDSLLNQDTFFLESDVDAISGMNLTMSLTFPTPTSNQDPKTGEYLVAGTQERLPSIVNSVSKDFLLSIIDRIEVRVGGLTVQRITPEEIWQRNLTEQDYSTVDEFLNSTVDSRTKLSIGGHNNLNNEVTPFQPPVSTIAQYNLMRPETRGRVLNKNQKESPIVMVREGDRVSWTLSLPVIGRTNNMHECFLQAGAVSNSITVVVFYNQVLPTHEFQQSQAGTSSQQDLYGTRGVSALLRLGKLGGFKTVDTAEMNMNKLAGSYQSYLTVKNHTFTNTEADFVQQNIVNRVVTASQSVVRQIQSNEIIKHSDTYTPLTGVSEMTGVITTYPPPAGGADTPNIDGVKLGQPNNAFTPAAVLNPVMANYGPFKTGGVDTTVTSDQSLVNGGKNIKALQYTSTNLVPITINLDDVDINTSHLLISAFASTHTPLGTVSVSPLETINCGSQFRPAAAGSEISAEFDGTGNPYGERNPIKTGGFANTREYLQALCRQIYNFSGFSVAHNSQNVAPTGMIMRGALSDYVEFIEIVIGSDRSGRIPASSLLALNGAFGLTKSDAPIYVVPLADVPFSTAGVPMSRVGTKQVILYVDSRCAIDYGPFTQVDGNLSQAQYIYGADRTQSNPKPNFLPRGILPDDVIYPWAPITKVAVTAVGTRVQTTVGGSTSFSS